MTTKTNEDRASQAAQALDFYADLTGCDDGDALRDLLTDLRHAAGEDFAHVLWISEIHFDAEQDAEK